MRLVVILSISLLMISLALVVLSWGLSPKPILDREKSSPFECGFDPDSSSRVAFSLRFFLIAVVFLVFDVEIALLLPVLISHSEVINWGGEMSAFFLLILLGGTLHEWNQGALQWSE